MKLRPVTITQFFLFLLPLFFLPITRDFIDFNKSMLLIALSLVSLIVYAVKVIKSRELAIHFDRTHAAVLALAGAYIASLLFITPNKIEALLQAGGVGTVLALVILFFTVPQLTPFKNTRQVITPLLLAGVFVSFFTILSMFGVLEATPIVSPLKNPNLTPAGTLLTATLFLGIVAIAAAKEIIMSKDQSIRRLVLYGAAFLIVLAGAVVNSFRLTQDETRPAMLPTAVSWTIAAENIKVPRQALLGVGPGNYVNAFTIGRTAEVNNSDIWNIRFSSASNYMLHLFTELGILGLVSFLLLVYFVARHPKKSLGAILSLIVLAVLPHNTLLLMLLFVFLMVMSSQSAPVYKLGSRSMSQHGDAIAHALGLDKDNAPVLAFIPAIAAVVLIAGAGTGLYFQQRAYAAEMMMTKGILSAVTPNNQDTYDLQRDAIRLNPYHSEYRIIFSRTNLALANLISQKPELTEADTQTVTQLVVQSVNNGKLAVQLKPSANTWANLATIYRNLIGSAQGAPDWTVQSMNQAILFDRTNPLFRLSLGQVYFGLQLFEPAAQQFEFAIQLKPDCANCWYNLANINRQLGNIQVARVAYQQTLALVPADSPDAQTVQAELDALPDTIAQEDRNLQELDNPEDSLEDGIDTEVTLDDQASPELTFPEDVAGEATQSADAAQNDIDLNEPSPTATPTPSE